MFAKFPLFQSHLDMAHSYWQRIVLPGDTVIDATCGNGHDTLALARMALTPEMGALYGLDIQPKAVEGCRRILQENLPADTLTRVTLHTGCHSCFPASISPHSVRLIVYNLGYLPGGDKSLTTAAESTIASLEAAKGLLMPGGALSITCYPGHAEGLREEGVVFEWSAKLEPQEWSCCHHRWLNRKKAPSLLFVQKGMETSLYRRGALSFM